MWSREVIRTGTSQKARFWEGCVPVIRSWASKCLRPILGLSEEHKSKKRKKTKSRHMWICKRLFGHYWPGTATGPNVPLPCHETWSTHPLTGSPGGHPQCCHLQCLLSYQDSPLHSLTAQDDTDSDAVTWMLTAKSKSSDIAKKMNWGAPDPLQGLNWSGSFKVNFFSLLTFTINLNYLIHCAFDCA